MYNELYDKNIENIKEHIKLKKYDKLLEIKNNFIAANFEKQNGRIVIPRLEPVYKHLDNNQYIIRSSSNKKKIMQYRNTDGMMITNTNKYFIARSNDMPKNNGRYIIKNKSGGYRTIIRKHTNNVKVTTS